MAVVVDTFSGAPANRTRATMATAIARYVLLPNNTEALAVAADGINDAIRRVNTRIWHWSLTTEDITLVADTSTYTLATSFRAPRSAELLDSSSNCIDLLGWLDPKSFDLTYPKRDTSGTPEDYTVFQYQVDGKLTLSAPPSSAFVATYPTLRARFYRRLPYLSNDSDAFGYAPSEIESFVEWYARSYIASIYDTDKIGHANRMADTFWGEMIRSDAREQVTDWSGG